MTDFSSNYWEDALVLFEDSTELLLEKDGFVCWCPSPDICPGDADSIIRGGQAASDIRKKFGYSR